MYIVEVVMNVIDLMLNTIAEDVLFMVRPSHSTQYMMYQSAFRSGWLLNWKQTDHVENVFFKHCNTHITRKDFCLPKITLGKFQKTQIMESQVIPGFEFVRLANIGNPIYVFL